MVEQVRSAWCTQGRVSALRTCSSLLSTNLSEELRLDLLGWQIVLFLEMVHRKEATEVLRANSGYHFGGAFRVAKAYYNFLQGQMISSCSEIDAVLDESPDWLSLYVGVFCHAHLLKSETAIPLIERWHAFYPADPLVLRRAFELLQALGYRQKASEYRCALIRQKPESVHAFLTAAMSFQEEGRLDLAMREYREGIDHFGEDDELWSQGAACLLRQHLYKDAVGWALRALQRNSRNYLAYSVLESYAKITRNLSVAKKLHQIRRSLLADMPPVFAPITSLLKRILDTDTKKPYGHTQSGSCEGTPLVRSVLQRVFASVRHRAERDNRRGGTLPNDLRQAFGEKNLLQEFLDTWGNGVALSEQRELLLKTLLQAAEEGEREIAEWFAEALQSTLSPDPFVGITEILSLFLAGLVDEAQKLASAYAEAYPQVEEYPMLRDSFRWRLP